MGLTAFAPKRSKYGSVHCYLCAGCGAFYAKTPPGQCSACHAIAFDHFDSKAEAMRYARLKLREKTVGDIRDIRRQVNYDLLAPAPNGGTVVVAKYRADFVYEEAQGLTWVRVVEDCKGHMTPLAGHKLKHMAAQGITVKLST